MGGTGSVLGQTIAHEAEPRERCNSRTQGTKLTGKGLCSRLCAGHLAIGFSVFQSADTNNIIIPTLQMKNPTFLLLEQNHSQWEV